MFVLDGYSERMERMIAIKPYGSDAASYRVNRREDGDSTGMACKAGHLAIDAMASDDGSGDHTTELKHANPSRSAAQLGRKSFPAAGFRLRRRHFAEAIRLDPNQAAFQYGLALCEWTEGQMAAAGQRLHLAVRLDARLAIAHSLLGEWYLQQGMIDAAAGDRKRPALDSRNPTFMQSRAWVLEAAGETGEAWRIVKQLLAGPWPMNPPLARLYGRLAVNYGECDQALEAIMSLLGAGVAGRFVAPIDRLRPARPRRRYDEAFAMAEREMQLIGDDHTIQPSPRIGPSVLPIISRANESARCRKQPSRMRSPCLSWGCGAGNLARGADRGVHRAVHGRRTRLHAASPQRHAGNARLEHAELSGVSRPPYDRNRRCDRQHLSRGVGGVETGRGPDHRQNAAELVPSWAYRLAVSRGSHHPLPSRPDGHLPFMFSDTFQLRGTNTSTIFLISVIFTGFTNE